MCTDDSTIVPVYKAHIVCFDHEFDEMGACMAFKRAVAHISIEP